jgi:hypothetical protein
MDFFRDYFTAEALMGNLVETPYTPGLVGSLGVFRTIPLPGTVLALETLRDQDHKLPVATPRGTPGNARDVKRGVVNTFTTQHYKQSASVIPDEVLDMRNPGTAARQTLETRRNEKLAGLRRDTDLLLEKLRMDVLTTPNAATDGQALYGSAGTEQTIAFQTDGTKLRKEVFTKVRKPIETALGGLSYTGVVMLWEDGGWQELLDSPYIKGVMMASPTVSQQLLEQGRDEIEVMGVRHIRYRAGGGVAPPTNKAIAFPVGVQNLFVQAFAPADTMDQVGSGVMGGPYYVEGRAIDEGRRGYQMDIQTNPVMVCTRPGAVFTVKLT